MLLARYSNITYTIQFTAPHTRAYTVDTQGKTWFKPMFEDHKIQENDYANDIHKENFIPSPVKKSVLCEKGKNLLKTENKNWMKNFEPQQVEDLAVAHKKVQEVEEWMKAVISSNNNEMLLLTGPVGCGKTVTIQTLASKYNIKVSEWITPLDIDLSEYGEYEYRERQSKKFLDFIINVANFTSLLDNNDKKLILVEDFPNTFMRTPTEFTDVLQQYKLRARSPIVFVCSESHTDVKNTSVNLFTPVIKEQFKIHHIIFNGVTMTGLKSALKRVSEIISQKYTSIYTVPTSEMIECIANSSVGDVRSAVLNLHFACLKGSNQTLGTNVLIGKGAKTKIANKKKTSSKFISLGKDQTVNILHGVGRVLNPKVIMDEAGRSRFSHAPEEIIEQFITQTNSFVNFIQENYLPHFKCIYDADKAASVLSDADFMLAEWREKMCQEYGLYISTAGLMVANKTPVSAWNPVRGPKNSKVQYPSHNDIPFLEENNLYKSRVLVTDYKTFCKIIDSTLQ